MLTVTATADGTLQSFDLPANLSGTIYIRVIDTNRTKGKTTLDNIKVDHLYIRVTNSPPVAPIAPATLTATVAAYNQINLAWVDTSLNESSFEVERSLNGTTWTLLSTAAANVTTSQVTNLNTNTTYYFRVRAINLGGPSAYSNVASATTPSVPVMHVGNLTSTITRGTSGKWNTNLTFMIHPATETPLATVVVTGTWSNGATGTVSCTTNSSGTCSVSLSNLAGTTTSVTFTVNSLSRAGYAYTPINNHDDDGSSNGTTIIIRKP